MSVSLKHEDLPWRGGGTRSGQPKVRAEATHVGLSDPLVGEPVRTSDRKGNHEFRNCIIIGKRRRVNTHDLLTKCLFLFFVQPCLGSAPFSVCLFLRAAHHGCH